MSRLLLVSGILTLCAGAQGAFVVPQKAGAAAPGVFFGDAEPQRVPFFGAMSGPSAGRVQYLYDVADVAVASANLTGLAVRAPHTARNGPATTQTSIVVSVGPNAPPQAAPSFAANHGPSPATVFSGAINLPAVTPVAWPAPWQPAIPFAQPFAYRGSAGASLVVEFVTTASSSSLPWTIEGYRAEWGFSAIEYVSGQCTNSAGRASSSWGSSPNQLVPGGQLTLQLGGYPTATPSLQVNALFLGLRGLGARVGALTTPFPVIQLGLPAAPSCEWAIDIVAGMGFPMAYVDNGTSASLQTAIPVPADPTLAGAQFFTQDLALDTNSKGAPELFPSIALRWRVGTGNPIPAATVAALFVPGAMPATGTVLASRAAALQLRF